MLKINDINQIINEALTRKGMTPLEASLKATGNREAIYAIRKGSMPSLERWQKLCLVLGIEFYTGLPNLTEESAEEVSYLGRIAAGGGDDPTGMLMVGQEDTGDETTSAPAGLTSAELNQWGGILAFEVSGASMAPKYNDGDTIYIYANDPLKYEPNKLIGKDCACYLGGDRHGESYLKRLRRGDIEGLFNLESINREWPTIENVELLDIRPVRYVKYGFGRR